jgi:hypothetical protein
VYPIPAKQRLSLWDIADHWSREIRPRREPWEVRDDLVKAWWRGELTAANGPSRPEMLRLLYKSYQDRIAFSAPGLGEPVSSKVLSDGTVVVFRCWSVPLPNYQPEAWDDTNCAEAFEAVEKAWSCERFEIVAISVCFSELTVAEFMSWIDETPYPTPTFWQIAPKKDGVNERNKPVTKTSAAGLAQAYVESEKAAGRQPKQMGLHKYALDQGFRGGRDFLNKAFKEIRLRDDKYEVRPGRPKNSR